MRLGDGHVEDAHGRVGGRALGQEAVQVEQQRGLARAVAADEAHALAVRDGEGDAVQRVASARVAVGQPIDGDGVHGRYRPPRASIAA